MHFCHKGHRENKKLKAESKIKKTALAPEEEIARAVFLLVLDLSPYLRLAPLFLPFLQLFSNLLHLSFRLLQRSRVIRDVIRIPFLLINR